MDVKVSLEGKPLIPNGFRLGIGDGIIKDPDLIEWDKYDWSMVYDANSLFYKAIPKDNGWFDRFKRGFNGNLLGMRKMFYNLQWKGVLDFAGLDTSKVVDMKSAFDAAWVTEIKNLDTSNVIDMGNMFEGCSLDIPQLNTSKVFNMGGMFSRCRHLTTIPQMDTSNVRYMQEMFDTCDILTTIPQMDTSKVIKMNKMFSWCTSLTTIPQMDTSNVTSMESMFYYCTELTTIPQMDTSNVTSMESMFYNCTKLTTVPQLDISNVNSMYNIFYSCEHLVEVRFKGNPVSISNINNMFYGITTNGTLYYDSRYDYSKIINKLPSTWTAVPYDVLN